jgi:hypothetical protein
MNYINIFSANYIGELPDHSKDADRRFLPHREDIMARAYSIQFFHKDTAAGDDDRLMPLLHQISREIYRPCLNSAYIQCR